MGREEFKILQKIEDMMTYGYPLLNQFPKAEKFSLAQDIRSAMNQMLRLTIALERKGVRKTALENLDVENQSLIHLLRIATQLHHLSMHSYGVWEKKLVEIGKMIGGLFKFVKEGQKS